METQKGRHESLHWSLLRESGLHWNSPGRCCGWAVSLRHGDPVDVRGWEYRGERRSVRIYLDIWLVVVGEPLETLHLVGGEGIHGEG